MADPTPTLPFYDLMFKNITLRMYLVYLLGDEAREMTIKGVNKALASGRINHAIAKTFPLDDCAGAHSVVEAASEVGNIVVTIAQ